MKKIDPVQARAALATWQDDPSACDRRTLATAVRWTAELLAEKAPGRSVEVRIPPFAAVQCVPGPVHRRGTPPAVVETDARTWLELATGALTWGEATDTGRARVSGERTDLGRHLPLV